VPYFYWITVVNPDHVSGIADLGVVFLLFLIGLDLSYERLLSMRRLVFGLGGLQILLTFIFLSLIITKTGETPSSAIVLGSCLSLSSTAIVLEVLAGQGRLKTGVGRVSFSILLAQDLAVIPILFMIDSLNAVAGGSIISSIVRALTDGALAVAIIVLLGKIVLQPLLRVVASIKSIELFTASVLFVVILTGVLAAVAGLSMALGAFVAGLLVAETEYRKAVEAIVEPFKGLLLGVFFFTVGMTIDPRELIREPAAILALVIGVIALKAMIIIVLARLFGQSWVTALETGFLLGPVGEFAFVVIGIARNSHLIDQSLASFIITAIAIGMALIPGLSYLSVRVSQQFAELQTNEHVLETPPLNERRHAIIVGHGRVGKVVAALLRQHDLPFIAADNDANAVIADRLSGLDVYYGDAANQAFLQACGIKDADAVVITLGSREVIDKIVGAVRGLRPDIAIVARARDIQHARHLYGLGVNNAVPETVEASLQISEAALIGMGIPDGFVRAAVEMKRSAFRDEIRGDDVNAEVPDSVSTPV